MNTSNNYFKNINQALYKQKWDMFGEQTLHQEDLDLNTEISDMLYSIKFGSSRYINDFSTAQVNALKALHFIKNNANDGIHSSKTLTITSLGQAYMRAVMPNKNPQFHIRITGNQYVAYMKKKHHVNLSITERISLVFLVIAGIIGIATQIFDIHDLILNIMQEPLTIGFFFGIPIGVTWNHALTESDKSDEYDMKYIEAFTHAQAFEKVKHLNQKVESRHGLIRFLSERDRWKVYRNDSPQRLFDVIKYYMFKKYPKDPLKVIVAK